MSRWVLPPAILLGGYMNNLHLYKIDLEYIKFLHNNYDNRVQYNSAKGKEYNENRPYVGILVDINGYQYFAPLEHPRPQHKTLKSNPHIIKIKDGNYGLIGLNNMIPVHKKLLIDFDINKDPNKSILLTQFIFCQNKANMIIERANEIYRKRTLCPNSFEEKVYCDFKKLEQGLSVYCRNKGIELPSYNKPVNKPSALSERIAAAKEAAATQDRHKFKNNNDPIK